MAWYHRPAPEAAAETKTLADPTLFELALFGVVPSASGVAISTDAVWRVPAARAGIRLISESIATLPVRFIQSEPNGAMQDMVASSYPPGRVVTRPNSFTTPSRFWADFISDFLISGDGVAMIIRVRGQPRELIRVPPEALSIERDMRTLEPVYRVALADGVSRVVSHRDVLHLRGAPRADGLRGRGLIHDARETLGLALVLERHAARLFAGGARPSGILTVAGKISAEKLKALRAAFEAAHGGEASGGLAIIESGEKFETITMKSTDAEFGAMRTFAIREIARCLNISPLVIGDVERQTYTSAEAAAEILLSMTLRPIIEAIEDEIELKLIPDADRDTVRCEFITDEFARANTADRIAAMAKEIEIGVATVNEARQRLGRSPVEGGDTPMTSVQSRPLGQPATTPNE